MKSFAGAIGLSAVLIGAAAGPGSTAPFEDRPGAGPSVPPGAAVSQAARGDADDDGIEDGLSAQIAAGPPNALFDVIVVFDGPDAVGRSRAAAGPFSVTQEFSVINGFQATLTAAQIRGLSRTPGLFRISGVSTVKLQDTTSNDDFGATNARLDFLLDGSGVTICVVDTGINAAHEQFDTKGPGSVPLGPLEFLDAVNGLANPYDDHGHGTHVAGSAAGDGTGSSIYAADGIGAAPGANIVAAKVLSASGEGSDAQVVAGIDWCAAQGDVDIVSMSLGGDFTDGSDPMSLAVNCVADPSGTGCSGSNDPKIVIVAAGNSGGVPASVMSPGVAANAITIGAAADWSAPPGDPAKDDGLYVTNFSSRGPVEDSLGNFVRTKPDLIAPGLRVHSALINNPTYPFYGTAPNYYAALSGTSMATPYVSGVVALMIEADPSLAVADGNGLPFEKVRDILTRTAVDRGAPGPDNEYGHGVIDAYSAVAHASLAVGFVPTAYPGYTRLPGQSVADFGTWTHQFTVTSGLVGLPIAGTLTAAGAVNPLFGIWSPDLEVEIERETTPGNWSLVTAGSNEVTQSLCPGQGECGVAGRVEVAHFRPQSTGNYRFRIYPADDIFNNGAGGDFDFEISMGAATPGVAPNYPPQAGFSLACTNLACSFSDASTDFDGTIVSHAWDFGGAGTANLADPLNPSFTYNATGYYKVTLTVTDDAGAEDSFFQFLTARAVGTVNQAPVAGFSATNADLTANLTDTSTDSDGAVVTRSWNFGDGSPASSATNPSHAYAAAGTYNVTLLVTDNEGAQDSITLPVTVTDPPPNMAPFASFIVDTNPCGSWLFLNTCQFTDTSIDDDGTIVGWQWNFGPSGTMIGGTPQQPLVRFLADGPNPVHVTLMVTDNEGATNTAFMDLPLRDPATPNDTPVTTVTAPANGSAFDLGVQVTFTGTATDTEDGDLSAQIAWSSSLDGAIGTGAGVSTSGLRAGTHTITASATDSGGLTGTDTISVTINAPPNTAPTATVTAPANGTTVTEGTLVSFTGTATDAEDGTITASLVWTSNLDGQIGTGGGFSTSALSIGTHTVTASITDSGGLSGTDTVSVIVNPLPNTAPTATVTAPANGTTVTEGTLVSFTGTATDAEDGTISASLVWTSDLDGQIGTGGGFSTSTLSIGTHTVTASVTDSGGLNGTDTVSVIVNPLPNTAPTATVTAPANGSSFDEGTLISFTGTATDAEDGTITASLVWTSNLDGQIGTGGAFSTSTLSAGIHTVTASVTDSGGLSGQDAISVTVNGAPAVTNVHIADLDDDSAPAPRNRWDARVAVLVLDEVGAAIPNAQVSGSWTSGTTGGGSCTTNASGQCVVIKPNLKGNVTGATFEIGDITGTDIAYQPAENTDPDGDSDGTVINVLQPGTTPTNTAPSASITAPGDGSSFDPGVMVTFNGTASDTEDGDLSTSLSWSSDLNGPIGSGSTASSSILSEGTHVITASVTDSGGLSGTDTITVTIGSAPPPPPPPTGLTLVSAVGYKVKGLQWVDLTWSGATGTNVIIRRDGIDVETTLNDDFHPHSIGSKGSGSYNFQICETDGITCSGVVTVVF